jgi:DNA repair exonuclease SbcCD ATPase subunit
VDTIVKSEPCDADAESKLIEQQELRDRMNNAQYRHQNLINHIMDTQIAYSRHAQLLATRLKTLTEEQKVLKTELSSLENSMASSKSLVEHLEKEKDCAAGQK